MALDRSYFTCAAHKSSGLNARDAILYDGNN